MRQIESLPNLPLFASDLVLVSQRLPVSYCAGIAPLLGWFSVMAMIPTSSTPLKFTLTGSLKAAAAFHPRLKRPGFSRSVSIENPVRKAPNYSPSIAFVNYPVHFRIPPYELNTRIDTTKKFFT